MDNPKIVSLFFYFVNRGKLKKSQLFKLRRTSFPAEKTYSKVFKFKKYYLDAFKLSQMICLIRKVKPLDKPIRYSPVCLQITVQVESIIVSRIRCFN
jgi:hypothetical protein